MNLEGRLLGNRYEIIEKVGNGGMATVYKAKCHVLNRFVAVKVLKDEFTTDEEFIKRFNTEAQAVASLTHPNIVSVYDVGHEGNLYYIVMELIKGRTLKEIITEEGKMSWKWSVNVAIQIASALETAHKNKIIHRDIKPHNIIITEDGIAKVTDFGIAKSVSNSTITAFGTTIGSVHYFSPEHARGGFTDEKSDLYSLGVVLYEMVTGKVPFNADTPVSIALKHMQETPVEPKVLNNEIPNPLNKIIMKAMQKEVTLRYLNATEMLRDLSMALKNPDGNFVVLENSSANIEATQRISTIYDKSNELENRKEVRDAKKEKGFKAFIKSHKVLSFIVGLIIIFGITISATILILQKVSVKDVQIPNVVGLSTLEAEDAIKGLNLVYEVQEEVFDKEVPAGFIISQDPVYVENYKIKEKNTIKVVVSKGQELVIVPKLVGLTKDEAIAALEDKNLLYEIEEKEDKDVEAGIVISQSIEKDKEVYAGETVKIIVSKEIEKVNVPSLIGKTEEEAKKEIENAKLKLKTVLTAEDKTKNDGTVIKQSLEAGTEIEKDTEITITINSIPKQKEATINVNLKSILDGKIEYEKEYDEETGETIITDKPINVELKIEVDGDTVYSESVKPTLDSISTKISGVGTVEVKVWVDGVRKANKQINLNEITSYTFE